MYTRVTMVNVNVMLSIGDDAAVDDIARRSERNMAEGGLSSSCLSAEQSQRLSRQVARVWGSGEDDEVGGKRVCEIPRSPRESELAGGAKVDGMPIRLENRSQGDADCWRPSRSSSKTVRLVVR